MNAGMSRPRTAHYHLIDPTTAESGSLTSSDTAGPGQVLARALQLILTVTAVIWHKDQAGQCR